MAVYLLHIEPPLAHASHYVGWAANERNVALRFEHHIAGRGARMVAAAVRAGRRVTLAYVWPTGDRAFERMLKRRKDAPRYCPLCGGRRLPEMPAKEERCS